MKRLARVAAGAAVAAGLAACSHTTAPSSASASRPAVTHSTVVVNCGQRYDTWKHGQGKGLVAEVTAVSSADTAGDMQVLTAALKKAGPAVARAARYPMPACADPKGYWGALLMHLNAAAASTGSASDLRAAMKGVPKVTHQITAELKRLENSAG